MTDQILWGPHRKNEVFAFIPKKDRPLFTPGNVWEHYKGGTYVVVDVVLLEANGECCVAYRPLTSPSFTWIRPLSNWMESVDTGQGVKVARFTWVKASPYI